MSERFCPLKAALVCGPKCGMYSKLDRCCSINLLAEALISIVDVKGKVFTTIMASPGRVTIPLVIRQELGLKNGDRIRMVLVRAMEK